jgi:hypothetical protein
MTSSLATISHTPFTTTPTLNDFYLSMALQLFVGPWPLFQFLNPYGVGRTLWAVDHPIARPLRTQTQNKRT